MSKLNFPLSPTNGQEYTGDNGITYVFDGVKWIGHSPNLPAGTSAIVNSGYVVQVDGSGDLVAPNYTFPANTGTVGEVLSWPVSGTTLVWTTATGGNSTGNITFSNNTLTSSNNGPISFATQGGAVNIDNWGYPTNAMRISNNTDGDSIVLQANGNSAQAKLRWHETGNSIYSEVRTEFDGVKIVNSDWSDSPAYNRVWAFNTSGSITFPDASIQHTAWTSTNQLVNGPYSVVLESDGSLNIPGEIKNNGDVTITAGTGLYWWSEMGDLVGESTSTVGMGVVHDPEGNLWVFGSAFIGDGQEDTITMKYDANGNLIWNNLKNDLTGNQLCASNDVIAIDSVGKPWYLSNNLTLGYAYIGQMNPDGTTVNGQLIAIQGNGYDMTFDANNNMYVTGSGYSTGNEQPFVIKINTELYSVDWSTILNTTDNESANSYSITVDASGNSYIIGTYQNTSYTFISSLDTNGNILWTESLYLGQEVYGISIQYYNNYIYTASWAVEGTVISKFDTSGNQIWSNIFGVIGVAEEGLDINFDSEGNMYLSGVTAINYSNPTTGNIWISKIDPTSGAVIYQRTLSTPDQSLALNETGFGPYTPFYYGHRSSSIYQDRIAIAGLTYWNQESNTSTTATYVAYTFVAQLPLDGSLLGTYSGLTYADATDTILSTSTNSIGFTNSFTTFTAYTATIFVTSTTSFPNVLSPNTLTSVTYGIGIASTATSWTFGNDSILTFPNGTYIDTSSPDALTINSDGPAYWINQFGDLTLQHSEDYGNTLVYDNLGNVIVVMADYTETAEDYEIPMIVKYDPKGNLLWKKYIVNADGNPQYGSGESAAVDSNNNIYVLTNNYNDDSSWVFQISPYGVILNQIEISGTDNNINDIVVDSSDNFYLAGQSGLTSPYNTGVVVKGNFAQGIVWQTGFNYSSTSTYDLEYSIALDGAISPNVYVAGYGYNPGSGRDVPQLVKLDNNGTIQWITNLGDGDSANRYAVSVDVDAAGNSYVLINENYDYTIIASYDTNGNLRWQERLNESNTQPTEIQIGPDGYLYVTGQTNAGPFNWALFVVKLDTEGTFQWANAFTNFNFNDQVHEWEWYGHKDIAVNKEGVFAVTGYTYNPATTSTTTSYVPAEAITFQFPTDGTYAGSYEGSIPEYNGYSYLNLAWFTTATTALNNSSSTTWVEQSPGFTTTATSATIAVSTLTSNLITIVRTSGQWEFSKSGNIVFPDGSKQSTAWTGKFNTGINVAIGQCAGAIGQCYESVAIGVRAGYLHQGCRSVAIGVCAGANTQSNYAVAIGPYAGCNGQGYEAVAIGYYAGGCRQGEYAIAIGCDAGSYRQGQNAVAIGTDAGREDQSVNAVAIGTYAGYCNQGAYSIAIGYESGYSNQATGTIIINATGSEVNGVPCQQNSLYVAPIRSVSTAGSAALYYCSSSKEITAGPTSIKSNGEIAIGTNTAPNQNAGAIAIGQDAVSNGTQNEHAIAIGRSAGFAGQGNSAIAIGHNAAGTHSIYGSTSTQAQSQNSIVINALGGTSPLYDAGIGTLVVKPIRNATTSSVLYYDSDSGEITYGASYLVSDTSPELGGALHVNNYPLYGGSYDGNQLNLTTGAGSQLYSLRDGEVFIAAGTTGTVTASWEFNYTGAMTFPDGSVQTTAYRVMSAPPLSPWGTTVVFDTLNFLFDPTTGIPSFNGGYGQGAGSFNTLVWSADIYQQGSTSTNSTINSGLVPVQYFNYNGALTLTSSVLQPGDYVEMRIQDVVNNRVYRAVFLGSYNAADEGNEVKYGSITVERLV